MLVLLHYTAPSSYKGACGWDVLGLDLAQVAKQF